ncbi:methyltetrahydrofolate cobalamin methyltransferase [Alkalibacter mobilis]|uniref:methyltetrahydrofolate cobalamin methyltransferase n=1 Tax=Alkalibacter mobilis TaxID=2787712 RepID=UPI0018A028BD|nr:methyltetrahydrofolate cobalamin methyltransferase [Alkalibacter mobilis]MBF7095657.1 methyltetrahydrofolate cobalamin methyltransferase [Alkalibacter mobilis]
MIIIGEKLNGAIPSVKSAIESKDENFIREKAIAQAEAGANFIDVCAGTAPDVELRTLNWMIDIVQEAVETPLCIDSPDPEILKAVFPRCNKPGLVNSMSGEGNKMEVLLPLFKEADPKWELVIMTCDNQGIPNTVEKKLELTKMMVEESKKYGLTPDRIHIDPCIMALSTDNLSFLNFKREIEAIREVYPEIHITSGLSNISFGMPVRKLMNQNFMTLSMFVGMDSAVLDPLSRDLMGAIYATEALMGNDKLCRKYSNAYRKGKIGPIKK